MHRRRSSQGVADRTVLFKKPAQDTPLKMTIRIFFYPQWSFCETTSAFYCLWTSPCEAADRVIV
ncbi:hypothetical protein, partial [Pseudomonas syringae]|uniref:hypothetical protein n=1 Tax=Pseudomonas syringae TaxID=317 RepID=UPI001C80A11E